jgi:hypothetical protein
MTKQEREAIEQAMKPQRWGSKERVTLVAEVLRQKRIVRWLCDRLADFYIDSKKATPDYWLREAEQAVAEQLSPKT